MWIAENPKAKRQHRSFSLWSAYSPLQSWGRIAREWLEVQGSPAAEQVFFNDSVGRAYRAKSEAPPWEELRDRAKDSDLRRGVIPAGCPMVTMGVDCQGDRVECQIVAFGPNWQRAVVEYVVISGHISEKACRDKLSALVKSERRNAAGRLVGIDLTAIDGNAYTEDVWGWAKKHPVSKVIMVRGINTDIAPLIARVKKERDKNGKLLKYSRRFFNFNGSVLKMALYRNLAKTDPLERGFIAFPSGLEDEYFVQLTSERRVEKKGKDGFSVFRWQKDTDQANEALDTMNQAEVAAIKLGIRTMTEVGWGPYLEREEPPTDGQLDLEDLPLTATNKSPAKAVAKPTTTKQSNPDGKLSPMERLAQLNG